VQVRLLDEIENNLKDMSSVNRIKAINDFS